MKTYRVVAKETIYYVGWIEAESPEDARLTADERIFVEGLYDAGFSECGYGGCEIIDAKED